jgi:hypothetical protein
MHCQEQYSERFVEVPRETVNFLKTLIARRTRGARGGISFYSFSLEHFHDLVRIHHVTKEVVDVGEASGYPLHILMPIISPALLTVFLAGFIRRKCLALFVGSTQLTDPYLGGYSRALSDRDMSDFLRH